MQKAPTPSTWLLYSSGLDDTVAAGDRIAIELAHGDARDRRLDVRMMLEARAQLVGAGELPASASRVSVANPDLRRLRAELRRRGHVEEQPPHAHEAQFAHAPHEGA